MRKFLAQLSVPDRLAYGVLALATLWMTVVGFWEIAAPFGAGHVAVLPARAIMADNMITYGILYPVRAYSGARPEISQAYAHHPFGTYYLFALVRLLFGRHEWAIRLVPVCVSMAMPSLLFFVANRLWGKASAALSALGWAVLPITLAFAQFPSFEMFSLAGMLGVTLSALRFVEAKSRLRFAELLLVTFAATNTDWLSSLYVLATAATALFLVAFGPKRAGDGGNWRPLLQATLGTSLVVVFTIGLYVVVFRQSGLFEDFLGSADHRARGNELPFSHVLEHRRYWIELMFTKLGITVGVVGATVMVLRVLVYRHFTELLPLLLLLVSTFHYVHFKNGADVHIYWPLPFAAQFCLSLGVISVTFESALARWAKRAARPSGRYFAAHAATGAVGLLALGVLPDGLRALDYARDSGCRLNDDGQLNLQDYDKTRALEWFKGKIPVGARVMLQNSLMPNWSQDYALERPTVVRVNPRGANPTGAHHILFDLRFAPNTTLTWAQTARHEIVGPYLYLDSEAEAQAATAYSFEERRPNFLERYFVQAHDPIYRVVPDPYRTWELNEHWYARPNPPPPELERPEHARVAFNVAVSNKDDARAKRLLAEIERGLDRASARLFVGGTRLIGHRLLKTTPPRLEIYFLAAGPLGADAFFDVRSQVIAAPPLSFVRADDKEKKYGTGFEFPAAVWKSGFLYVSRVEVRERPGKERFYARWLGVTRPLPVQGSEVIELFERP